MAEKEDTKKEEGGDKLVAYKLLKPLGENAEGSIIHVPEAVGEKLCEAGVCEYASEDDMGPQEDEETDDTEMNLEDTDMVTNSIDKLGEKIETVLTDSVAKAFAVNKPQANQTPMTVPASTKEKPYATNGHYLKAVCRQVAGHGTKADADRIMAYQEMAAEGYKKKGIWDAEDYAVNKSILGINETTNSSGGFLVNDEFSADVAVVDHDQFDLAAICETVNAKGHKYNQRYIVETSLANGSIYGGLNMVAAAEGATLTSSLPTWGNLVYTLNKFAIFNYYTVEVLEDASYPVEQMLNQYANKVFLYGINSQIIQGTTIEGVINSPGLVTVTHSSNDTSFTANPSTNLTYADLANMWSAALPGSQSSKKGVWLFHPSLLTALSQMTYTFNGTTPAWSINYTAEDGLSGVGAMTPYRIFSKPAYASWACSAPGSAGDILYLDFATFKNYKKPYRVEISREFQFGTDQVAVRMVNRLDCKSWFRNPVVGPSGTQQFSALITRSATGS